ncbi:hypothetical protein CGRA01v4_01377 [Colletotrichum graminicola]|nr:hypothetical protein CGRA01v4_01377 [Colletotrichum graminicola]
MECSRRRTCSPDTILSRSIHRGPTAVVCQAGPSQVSLGEGVAGIATQSCGLPEPTRAKDSAGRLAQRDMRQEPSLACLP